MFLFILERAEEEERNTIQLPLNAYPNQGSIHNVGMCPVWESNPQFFGAWDDDATN